MREIDLSPAEGELFMFDVTPIKDGWRNSQVPFHTLPVLFVERFSVGMENKKKKHQKISIGSHILAHLNFSYNKTKYFRLRLNEAQRDFRLTWG